MSRIGKPSIEIPDKTEVTVADGMLRVKGPVGELSRTVQSAVEVSVQDGVVSVTPRNQTKLARALWGTVAAHIKNMIKGVNVPYEKKLLVEGIGYRAALSGDSLELNVGFSHPVLFTIPNGLSVSVEKNEITVSGPDKERVGQFAAEIRSTKKPEPYKGKGIRYGDEVVRKKQGKRAVT